MCRQSSDFQCREGTEIALPTREADVEGGSRCRDRALSLWVCTVIGVSRSEIFLEKWDAENSGGNASPSPRLVRTCRKEVVGFPLPSF